MRLLLPRVVWLVGVLSVWASAGIAASPPAEVEVTGVRFTNVRVPASLSSGGGSGPWLEADVALNVRPPPGSPGQMVPRVRVTLIVGFELPASSAAGEGSRATQGADSAASRRLDHYRAEAECVALESGRADVRFYLPPEIVKRDQLHGDPRYWGVEVAVAGKPLTPSRGAYATSLQSADQRKNFQTRAGAAAAANDGILQPQYLTPFAHEYPRATPTFVRREGR